MLYVPRVLYKKVTSSVMWCDEREKESLVLFHPMLGDQCRDER